MSNLVELVAKYLNKWHKSNDTDWTDEAYDLLNIVKEHIGEVAEVCPFCFKCGFDKNCHYCHGSGVVARKDEV